MDVQLEYQTNVHVIFNFIAELFNNIAASQCQKIPTECCTFSRLALIQSVTMLMTDETATCSSHNIYPAPRVTWATEPQSAQETVENSTIKTTDHRGLFHVESTLRTLGSLSNYTYICSFTSADRSQVWTASWKNQGVCFGFMVVCFS